MNISIPPTGRGLAVALLMSFFPAAVQAADALPRERLNFNEGWRFQRNDPPGTGDRLDYFKGAGVRDAVLASVQPGGLNDRQRQLGTDVDFTRPTYSDAGWRTLNLPHDWGVEGPFDQKLPGETGKLPWAGVGWYRKSFRLPAEDAGRRIFLDVDGAMAYAMVWCNGQFVGGWPYGYSSFRLDLTPYLKFGADNSLVVRVSNPDQSSRWYPGSGIYRNVWLVKTDPIHVAHWGTTITTPEVRADAAKVVVKTTVANDTAAPAKVDVRTDIFAVERDGRRSTVPAFSVTATGGVIPRGQKADFAPELLVKNPRLWSVDHPNLYAAVTTVTSGGRVVDRYETTFGIRTIAFKPESGFFLNGERVPIKGVCNHHDLGALGSAFNVRAAERQLQMLKEMGCNALRTSHNPPAPELLDLCDRMGFLVMDESFDCWKRGKKANDYSRLWDDWHERDLRAVIRRDRNHPSIIMWSIGNEVLELGKPEEGVPIATALTAIVRDEDPSRPSVLGSNSSGASYNGIQKSVGVMGQNYQFGGYGKFRKENPAIPLVGSETASTVSSRGEYFFQTPDQYAQVNAAEAAKAAAKGRPAPVPPPFSPVSSDKGQGRSDFQVSSYNLYGPGWASLPDNEFRAQEANPHVAGEFVWTGFDYLGEPTPYNGDTTNLLNFHDAEGRAEMERQLKELGKIRVPSRSSYFGIIDLAGFKKDRFYLYQAHWRPDLPMAHILPHWNWPERLGLGTPVHVYTSGDEAELFLNGKSLGRKKKGPQEYRLRWDDVVYQPGELQVVAYKNGREWAKDRVKTTGPAAKLKAEADRPVIAADGADLAFLSVDVADAEGLTVPRSENQLEFALSGPGEIVAVDNGDATSFEPFQASRRKAFNGRALVIVRGKKGEPGEIALTAKSAGLSPATVKISTAERQP